MKREQQPMKKTFPVFDCDAHLTESPDQWKNLTEKEKADFPLLSDPTKETAKAYGVLNDRGVANRWTFYIDKNGKISYIEKMVKPETSAEDMIAKLSDLKIPMTHGTK